MLTTVTAPDGQQVLKLSQYPTDCPQGSTPLPLTRRREYLSAFECIADEPLRRSQAAQLQTPPQVIFKKAEAVAMIIDAVIHSKGELKKYLYKEELSKPKKSLEKLKQKALAKIPEDFPNAQKSYAAVYSLFEEWTEQAFLENNQTLKRPPFTLNREDFRLAGANYDRYQANGCTPLCQDFVFYMVHEEHAIPHLFNAERVPWPKEILGNPSKILTEWGYELVAKPSPGDIVVYCSTMNGFIQSKHWGIWTPNNKVLSKPGFLEPMEGTLEDAPVSLGNFVFFFRKKIRSMLARELLKEIERVPKSAMTPQSFMQHMRLFCEQCPIPQTFSNCIYNSAYNEDVKKAVLAKLERYESILKSETKIEEVLGTISSIVRAASASIPPKF